jgi:CRISPR/Cas system-associated endoribonuclease Cas2
MGGYITSPMDASQLPSDMGAVGYHVLTQRTIHSRRVQLPLPTAPVSCATYCNRNCCNCTTSTAIRQTKCGGGNIAAEFESSRAIHFDLRHVRLCGINVSHTASHLVQRKSSHSGHASSKSLLVPIISTTDTNTLQTMALLVRDFVSGYGSYSLAEVLRVTLLLLASIGIIMAEYRLSGFSLKNSLAAMGCAGLAGALRKAVIRHHAKDKLGRKEESFWLVGFGCVIGTVEVILFWPDKIYILSEVRAMSLWLLLPLTINVFATTTALLLGRSVIFPMDDDLSEHTPGADNTDEYDVFVLLFLTGVVGFFSAFALLRSYTNWIQYCCFALAMLCASCKMLTTRRKKRKHWRDHTSSYELLDGPTEAPTYSEEEVDSLDISGSQTLKIRNPFNRTSVWKINFLAVVGACILLVVWGMAMSGNYVPRDSPGKAAIIDHNYEPSVPLDIVINMYKEPMEDLRKLVDGLKSVPETTRASITIYTKDQEANTKKIKLATSADKVIKLPNIGREGETYLRHINTRWDSLAKHTMYLPADTHFSPEFYRRIRNYFDPDRTGFLSLTWSYVCDSADCGDPFFWHDTAGLFPKYHHEIYNSTNRTNVLLSYKGTFIVSAARTRGVSKTMYEELWQAFVDENSWAHQQNFTLGRLDSMSAPDFGYTMERMWGMLFQCSNANTAWKCPSLKSGWRVGGDVADCQCLDSSVPTTGPGATGLAPQQMTTTPYHGWDSQNTFSI